MFIQVFLMCRFRLSSFVFFFSSQFATPDVVLSGARHMVAAQIAHNPVVRQCIREVFYDRCTLSCSITQKGMKVIDEAHQLYTIKYLKGKSVKSLQNEEFLKIVQAEEDGLMTYQLRLDGQGMEGSYFQEIQQLYQKVTCLFCHVFSRLC